MPNLDGARGHVPVLTTCSASPGRGPLDLLGVQAQLDLGGLGQDRYRHRPGMRAAPLLDGGLALPPMATGLILEPLCGLDAPHAGDHHPWALVDNRFGLPGARLGRLQLLESRR